MAEAEIEVVNECTVLGDVDLSKAVRAVQTQVRRDFYPIWGVDARISFIPKREKPRPDTWWIGVFDNSDKAGALGYHDLTSTGLPLGKVFAESDILTKSSWTNDLSHEVLEMLADPDINLSAYREEGGRTALYAYEVCDPCEDDPDGYLIDEVLVSDFVFPAWFEGFRKEGSAQFDFRKRITGPFRLLPNGYIGVFDPASHGGWHQVSDKVNPDYLSHPRLGSRRQRRNTPRGEWLPSSVETA
jgi:hypothetical protein